MFGYLRVKQDELLVREYEQYKAVYCSLCKNLGRNYSVFARFILSYDFTFYAMFCLSLKENCPQFIKGRCTSNPLKKCTYCKGGQDELDKAAALSVITAYYKLLDDYADENIFKKLRCIILKPFFGRWRKKAAKKYQHLDDIISQMMKNQFLAENDVKCHIDMAADPTAVMMSKIFEDESQDETQRIILSELGYYMGRWIYLIDAIDDLQEDIKHNSFNPFKNLYIEVSDKKAIGQATLNHCLSKIEEAYNLLELKQFNGIIKNVLLLGLYNEQNRVFEKIKESKEGK